ncbi:MAG: transcriptional repressor LexA [Promethearchaeota archaeon]
MKKNELKALRFIRNQLMHVGRAPTVRMLMEELGYCSPRAAAYILEKLESKGFINRQGRGKIRLLKDIPQSDIHAQTVDIPLVGSVPCGSPVFAEENIEGVFPISTRLTPSPYRYFLIRAVGDSMTEKGIHDGNLVLVRQQSTADTGDLVVALVDGEATIKEFHRSSNAVVLKPRSNNKYHLPIILTEDFRVLGVVKSVIDI